MVPIDVPPIPKTSFFAATGRPMQPILPACINYHFEEAHISPAAQLFK